jgi:hypothetical protein
MLADCNAHVKTTISFEKEQNSERLDHSGIQPTLNISFINSSYTHFHNFTVYLILLNQPTILALYEENFNCR